MSSIQKLLEIMADLRNKETGCSWDLEQDFASVAPYTVEEAYEVADAIARNDLEGLRDELGDLLFQVVFHAQMAEEEGAFNFEDVATAICDKMVRRHPHVFGTKAQRAAGPAKGAWEQIKAAERAEENLDDDGSAMEGVANALPALKRAEKLGNRASRVGFDWPDTQGVRAKISEEANCRRTGRRPVFRSQSGPPPQRGSGAGVGAGQQKIRKALSQHGARGKRIRAQIYQYGYRCIGYLLARRKETLRGIRR